MQKEQTPKQEAQENPQKVFLNKTAFWIFIAAIIVLSVTSVVSAFFIVKQVMFNKGEKKLSTYILGDLPVNTNFNQEPQEEPGDTTSENQDIVDIEAEIDPTEGDILVEWNEWPAEEYSSSLIEHGELKAKLDKFNSMSEYLKLEPQDFFEKTEVYEVGTIKQGPYLGDKIYIVTILPDGMASRNNFYRVIKNGSDLIVLGNYSDDLYEEAKYIFKVNNEIKIANLTSPEIIIDNSTGRKYTRGGEEPRQLFFDFNPQKIFAYRGDKYLYRDVKNHCYFIKKDDGSIEEYSFELGFFNRGGGEITYYSTTPSKLDFTWGDGTKNENEYIMYYGVYGGRGCLAYIFYITADSQVKRVGRTAEGDIIYELADLTLKENANDKKTILQKAYDDYYPGYDSETNQPKEKVPFEEFISEHPILFWKDDRGEYVEFRNNKFSPAVEMGKPVIYLYPKEETNVAVWVQPTGGFTVTEPAYNNGWKVYAKPSGELYNYGDKQKYPYLFWEGRGLNYKRPEQGFVVPAAGVKKFLEEKLATLGLIKKEYDEFIEFWLPKMQSAPYYFITFVPQEEFDKLAPLSVYPKPDTVIRVFMDYQPLERPVKVSPLEIVTPKRVGFTVIEWGGALHK